MPEQRRAGATGPWSRRASEDAARGKRRLQQIARKPLADEIRRGQVQLLGSRGNNWEILTAGAFVTIVVPLIVFFSLQRYFVRGLLAGSVK